MPYNVVQKISNNYYLYEVTSEWDPVAKRSRQKRKYIGKCDEKGNLAKTESTDVISRDFGEYYLLFHIARECGLWDALCNVYGAETAKVLLSYSFVRCTRCCPPTQSAYEVKNSSMPDYFSIPLDSRLLTLDGYLSLLRIAFSSRGDLFRTLPHGESAIVYNSDVLREPISFYKLYGSKSRFNFNEFPHKALFSAVNKDNYHPFYFKMAKYNGVDRISLNSVCDDLRSMDVTDITFNLRIPACTEAEVPKYLASNFSTILNLTPESPFAHDVMCQHLNNMEYDTVFVFGSLYRYLKLSHSFYVTDCDMYIVQDTRAYEDMAHSFYLQLDSIENSLAAMKWSDDFEEKAYDLFGETGLLDMFTISRGKGMSVNIERKREAILHQESLFGRSLIITNSAMGIKEILQSENYSYRCDQDLSIFRTDLQGGAALFPSNETAIASMLGDFISHHLKVVMMDMMRETELAKEMNYLDVFSHLSMIKGHWVNGSYSVTKADSTQEKIYRTFGIGVPTSESRNAF